MPRESGARVVLSKCSVHFLVIVDDLRVWLITKERIIFVSNLLEGVGVEFSPCRVDEREWNVVRARNKKINFSLFPVFFFFLLPPLCKQDSTFCWIWTRSKTTRKRFLARGGSIRDRVQYESLPLHNCPQNWKLFSPIRSVVLHVTRFLHDYFSKK